MNCIGGIQGLNGLGPWRLSLNGRRPETPPHIMNTHTYEPHTLCTINTLRVARPAGGRVGCECNPARIQSADCADHQSEGARDTTRNCSGHDTQLFWRLTSARPSYSSVTKGKLTHWRARVVPNRDLSL